ncbi:hypothetical protein N302_08593, partial [Corvus brachyrhynchos]
VTVIGIVAFLTTLVASVVGVERAPGRGPVVAGAARHPCGYFHSDSGAADHPAAIASVNAPNGHVLAVKSTDSIFSIPGVFELHEGEPRRVPGDPHGSQRSIVAEGSLQLAFAGARAQIPHV